MDTTRTEMRHCLAGRTRKKKSPPPKVRYYFFRRLPEDPELAQPTISAPTRTEFTPTRTEFIPEQEREGVAMADPLTPEAVAQQTRDLEALRLQLEQREARLNADRTLLAGQRRDFDNERRRWGNEDEASVHNSDDEEEPGHERTLGEFGAPSARDVGGPVVIPGIEANNMQIAPNHVALVQQNPFYGDDKEDPHAHLQTFIDCTKLIKFNGVPQQAIRLLLFHFTLKDRAQKWYKTLKKGSIRSWDQMAQTFLDRYFPADRSDAIRRELNNFAQKEEESMRDAWERFRDLENSCPHHGIQEWMLIKSFYGGLYDNIKINIDSLSGGAFKRLDATQGRDLLDYCARNYTWYPIPTHRRSSNSKHQVHEITTRDERIAELEAELAAYHSAQGTHLYSTLCGACGEEGHKSQDCPLAKNEGGVAQVNSLNNEPSYFPRHVFRRSYSLSEGEQKDWEHMNDPILKNTMQKATLDRPYLPIFDRQGQNSKFVRRDHQSNNYGPHPRKSIYNKEGVPVVVQEFMHEQGKFNMILAEGLDDLKATTNELKGTASSLQRLERMMETHFSRPPGKLPGQPQVNPNAEMKALHVLRSGRQYEDPPMPLEEPTRPSTRSEMDPTRSEMEVPVAEEPIMEQLRPFPPLSKDLETEGPVIESLEDEQEPRPIPTRSEITSTRSEMGGKNGKNNASAEERGKGSQPKATYQPPVPFPQRLLKKREDSQFRAFWEILKQMRITIPFTDAIAQVPIYAKFLKELCTGKRSLEELKTVALTNQSSEALKSKMPPKLEDPGRFALPCVIGKAIIKQALCDMGASVSLMPKTVYEKIGFGELRPTRMTLQLADSSIRLPLGILEDIPVQVGKFLVPGDFVVMDMEEDKEVPIILGRPFLRTAGVMMDARDGTILVRVGEETLRFSIDKAMKCPSSSNTCCMIQELPELEETLEEQYQTALEAYQNFLCDVQESIGVEETLEEVDEGQTEFWESISTLNSDRVGPRVEELKATDSHIGPSYSNSVRPETPKIEMKPLPASLRYEFLDPDQNSPVIVNSDLDAGQTEKLLEVLRAHKGAIGYSIEDLKGIDPSICTHRILLEEDHKPTREAQRRLNPNLKEVVKKEILKLLDAGIIYAISDSKWVSPVHVVPKKGARRWSGTRKTS
ncbi:hypothetical protein LUZ63_003817 [Rhynchospora breviuscula]|uniref:CCHC-type domain-containing protein n=1 Tax=Rhynchospora breviuscula TaxID=2022672 RepID=A0A9Q0I0F3_9POAL|nr:hypothetical protein LUZ63_003817 [Rhynchospora breviuscula]